MKALTTILLLITISYTTAQEVVNEKNIKFIIDSSSLQVIKLNSDSNATSFAILIKDSVKAHYHSKHTESLMVLDGEAEMQMGDKTVNIKKGDFFVIPPKMIHAVRVTSKVPLKVISVQAPEFLGEDRIWVENK